MPIMSNAYNVLLFTDAEVVRQPVAETLQALPSLTLVAESHSRIDAVTKVKNHAVNLVLLDIGASDADRTLKRLREVLPDIPVILIGMLTFSNVRASMEALLLGAVEFIPTPTPHAANTDRRSFERNLVEILSGLHEREKPTPAPAAPSRPVRQEVRPQPTKPTPPNITLAKPGTKKPRVLLIGSSTGGPKAVTDVLEQLRKPFPLPILVTQHMPPGFTATFATNIQRRTGHTASEGKENELVQPGRVYIAPGGLHQILIRKGDKVYIHLDDGPQVNFCKPAVDPMFESAAKAYDGDILALVLTGMGHDGRDGARKIVDAGGTLIAQDAETSVVWGMPGAVAEAGLASEILPLEDIAARVMELCRS